MNFNFSLNPIECTISQPPNFDAYKNDNNGNSTAFSSVHYSNKNNSNCMNLKNDERNRNNEMYCQNQKKSGHKGY